MGESSEQSTLEAGGKFISVEINLRHTLLQKLASHKGMLLERSGFSSASKGGQLSPSSHPWSLKVKTDVGFFAIRFFAKSEGR